METFTEVTTFFLLYVIMSFTDAVGPEIRNQYGKVFIGIICLYITVHVCLLLWSSYRKMRYLVRKTSYNRKVKRLTEQRRLKDLQEAEDKKEDR